MTNRLRVNPIGQQPAEVGHREHALGEDIVQAGRPRDVEVDVHRVVIARRAREQSQRGPGDRADLQGRQLGADVDGLDGGHWVRSGFRTTMTVFNSATNSPFGSGHHGRLLNEFQRSALLAVDIRDPWSRGQHVAGHRLRVVGERLRAVEYPAQVDAEVG